MEQRKKSIRRKRYSNTEREINDVKVRIDENAQKGIYQDLKVKSIKSLIQ